MNRPTAIKPRSICKKVSILLLLFTAFISQPLLAQSDMFLQKAVESANEKLNSTRTNERSKRNSQTKPVYTQAKHLSDKCCLVTTNTSRGFAIVFENNDGNTIVGAYSLNGSYDEKNPIPPFESWLASYQATLSERTTSDPQILDSKLHGTAIQPLLTTKWNQGYPYNQLCPGGDTHMPTGCVATAVAQVMNFWEYPATGFGSVDLPDVLDPGILDLSQSKYDWNNMLDEYTSTFSQAQSDAVATLMRDVGYALESSYYQFATASSNMKTIPALVRNFHYSPDAKYFKRDGNTQEEWMGLIRESLEQGMPIVYSGGNHAFVCDGIDSDGMVHINWGWGGYYDGYFDFNTLTKDTFISGTSQNDFATEQDMVVGIRPAQSDDFDFAGYIAPITIYRFEAWNRWNDYLEFTPTSSHLNFRYYNSSGVYFPAESLCFIPTIYDASGNLIYQDLETPYINHLEWHKWESFDFPHGFGEKMRSGLIPDGEYLIKPMYAYWENGKIKGELREFSWDGQMLPLTVKDGMFCYAKAPLFINLVDITDIRTDASFNGELKENAYIYIDFQNNTPQHAYCPTMQLAILPEGESPESQQEQEIKWIRGSIDLFPNTSVTWRADVSTLIPLDAGPYKVWLKDENNTYFDIDKHLFITSHLEYVYNPNHPALQIKNGLLSVMGLSKGDCVSMYTLSGISIYHKTAEADIIELSIPVHNLTAGLYIVKYVGSKGTFVEKITLSHE